MTPERYAKRYAGRCIIRPMTEDEARDALRSWGRRRQSLDRDRDGLVTTGLAAGLSKEEVHMLTGLGRTTIDRIAAKQPAK